jgi:hypothetical protein
MAIIQEREEKKARILKATAFRLRVSESKEAAWKRKYKKAPGKFPDQLSNEVQNSMRKYRTDLISAKVWEEDWHDLFAEALKIVQRD